MSRSFWFEILGTEKYYAVSDDSRERVDLTKEEFDIRRAEKLSAYVEREHENLQRVDELICEFMGEPKPDRRFDSMFYWWCHEFGFLCLYKHGGSAVGDSPEHLPWLHEKMDEWIKSCLARTEERDEFYMKLEQEGYVARCHALVDWVFTKKWQFNACG